MNNCEISAPTTEKKFSGATLIAFIGRGTLEDDKKTYKTVDYKFTDQVTIRSAYFAKAVMDSQLYGFKRVIIWGSPTSAWATTLGDNMPEALETLWLQLEDKKCRKQPVTATELRELEQVLTAQWQVEVECHTFPLELDESNAAPVFDQFIGSALGAGDNIVFDITHAFRWCPIFMMSALKFKELLPGNLQNMEILYGELPSGDVRQLNTMWEGVKINQALNLFLEKFEFGPLSEYLDFWPSGQKALKNLSLCLQGNYLLQLAIGNREFNDCGDKLKQVHNALRDLEKIANPPAWSQVLKRGLHSFCRQLEKATAAERLLALAEIFAERKLYNQAIMALQMTYEVYSYAKNGGDKFPDYEKLKKVSRAYTERLDKNIKIKIHKLNTARNVIAHGGLKTSEDDGEPNPDNLAAQYQSALQNLRTIMRAK